MKNEQFNRGFGRENDVIAQALEFQKPEPRFLKWCPCVFSDQKLT